MQKEQAAVKEEILLMINSLPEKQRDQLGNELLEIIDVWLEQKQQHGGEMNPKKTSSLFSEN